MRQRVSGSGSPLPTLERRLLSGSLRQQGGAAALEYLVVIAGVVVPIALFLLVLLGALVFWFQGMESLLGGAFG